MRRRLFNLAAVVLLVLSLGAWGGSYLVRAYAGYVWRDQSNFSVGLAWAGRLNLVWRGPIDRSMLRRFYDYPTFTPGPTWHVWPIRNDGRSRHEELLPGHRFPGLASTVTRPPTLPQLQVDVVLPMWMVTAMAALSVFATSTRLRAALYARAARRRGRCPTCGYDLRATPDRCPECGATPVPPRYD